MTDGPTLLDEIDRVLDEQWQGLGRAGTWLSGAERRRVTAAARLDGDEPPTTESIDGAAATVARHAAEMTVETVDALERAGVDRSTYVEIVGIASRVSAIDTFDRGVGRRPRPLPDLVDGEPARHVVDEARRRSGWVPAVGAIGPPNALSSVAREDADQADLCAALYLSYEGMADLDADRGLHRTQMEFVAGRVSLLNDCFF